MTDTTLSPGAQCAGRKSNSNLLMRRPTVLTGILGLLMLAPTHCIPVQADPSVGTGGWTKTFEDNFGGTNLDGSKWSSGWSWAWGDGSYGGTHDWRPSYHNYAGYPAYNLSVNNGLSLRSARENYSDDQGVSHPYTSATVSTDGHFYQQYGYFEASIQTANTSGLDAGFWLLAKDHAWPPEIDAVEVPSGKNWGYGASALLSNYSDHTQFNLGSLFDTSYHTYAVDWEPDHIAWYIDGIQRALETNLSAIPNKPMFMIVSNELQKDTLEGRNEGDWVGDPDSATHPGQYPVAMHVAWVRAWQKNTVANANYEIVNVYLPSECLQSTGEQYMNVSGAYNVVITPVSWNNSGQQWTLQSAGNGNYRIVCTANTSLCLQSTGEQYRNVSGAYNMALTPVSWNNTGQLWTLQSLGNGNYEIVSVYSSSECLQSTGEQYMNYSGAYNVALTPLSWNNTGQQWTLVAK